jgi:predicted RNase H-like nuclease (RuvC/YqgF family)
MNDTIDRGELERLEAQLRRDLYFRPEEPQEVLHENAEGDYEWDRTESRVYEARYEFIDQWGDLLEKLVEQHKELIRRVADFETKAKARNISKLEDELEACRTESRNRRHKIGELEAELKACRQRNERLAADASRVEQLEAENLELRQNNNRLVQKLAKYEGAE